MLLQIGSRRCFNVHVMANINNSYPNIATPLLPISSLQFNETNTPIEPEF
jgi:hypothetical protein